MELAVWILGDVTIHRFDLAFEFLGIEAHCSCHDRPPEDWLLRRWRPRGRSQRLIPTVSRYSRGTQTPSSVGKPSWNAMKSRRSSARRLSSRFAASDLVGP